MRCRFAKTWKCRLLRVGPLLIIVERKAPWVWHAKFV